MDETRRVRRRQRIGDLHGELQGVGDLQSCAADQLIQRPARDVLHRDEADAAVRVGVVDGDDVGMIERRGGARFVDEARDAPGIRGRFGRQDLDRHRAVQVRVDRLVDDTHPAFAKFFHHLIVRNGLPDHWRSIIQIFAVRSLSGNTILSFATEISWKNTTTLPSERRAL